MHDRGVEAFWDRQLAGDPLEDVHNFLLRAIAQAESFECRCLIQLMRSEKLERGDLDYIRILSELLDGESLKILLGPSPLFDNANNFDEICRLS